MELKRIEKTDTVTSSNFKRVSIEEVSISRLHSAIDEPMPSISIYTYRTYEPSQDITDHIFIVEAFAGCVSHDKDGSANTAYSVRIKIKYEADCLIPCRFYGDKCRPTQAILDKMNKIFMHDLERGSLSKIVSNTVFPVLRYNYRGSNM